MATDADGQTIKVGQQVGFKRDVERVGTVVAIHLDGTVWVRSTEAGDFVVDADRCWRA